MKDDITVALRHVHRNSRPRTLADDGTTIVMATHEMAFARDVADRVVLLDAGRVLEEGAPADLFGAPREERTREFLARFTA